MKPNNGKKAVVPSQPVAVLRSAREKSATPRLVLEDQSQTTVLGLFAEGVDMGVELALHWLEAELVRGEIPSDSVQKILSRIHRLSREVQRCSLRQQVFHGRPVRAARARSAAASG